MERLSPTLRRRRLSAARWPWFRTGTASGCRSPKKKFDLVISEDELARRHEGLQLEAADLASLRGYIKLYATEVLQANEGCDFGIMKPV